MRRTITLILFLALMGVGVFLLTAAQSSMSGGGSTYTGTSPIVVTGTVISCPTCGTATGNISGTWTTTGNVVTTDGAATAQDGGVALSALETTSAAQAAFSGHGACTNQAVTANNANAAPTCTTITSAYVDSSIQTSSGAASTYAPIASPTFTGTVTIPAGASISGYQTTGTQNITPTFCATDTGSANAYAIAPSPAMTALTTNALVCFIPTHASTSTATLNVNGLGAKNLTYNGASGLSSTVIISTTQAYLALYDGTEWQIISSLNGATVNGSSFTTNIIPKATGTHSTGNSLLSDNGTVLSYNSTAGVSAGSFSAITAIQTTGGLVTTLTGTSDARLKNRFRPFTRGLDDILKIDTTCYHWNAEGRKITHFPAGVEQCGYTAQALELGIPESIGSEVHDGIAYKTISDRPVIAALINAVKAQQAQIDSLRQEIAEMRSH